MSAPVLAAAPQRGVSTALETWPADRQATVRMPTAAAVAVSLGLPGVPTSGRSQVPVPFRADVLASRERTEVAPRIDVLLRDDGTGDVLVDDASVASGISVAETQTAIVALVLDLAGRAGRPVQVSVVSTDSLRRTLVAPDGSVCKLGADVQHGGTASAETSTTQAPPSPQLALRSPWPGIQLRDPVQAQTEAAVAEPSQAAEQPPPDPLPHGGSSSQRLVPGSPWPGSQPREPVPTQVAPRPTATPQIVAQSRSVVRPQSGPVALAPVPADLWTEPTPPGEPAVLPDLVARSNGAVGTGPKPLADQAHPLGDARPPDDGLPVRPCPPAPLVFLGAHGGAGESALASLMPGWRAADHAWPAPDGARQPVVLVARTSLVGLTAARTAVAQWASGQVPHVELLGVVLVADAPGRLPRRLRDLAKAVSVGAPRVWHVPWVTTWRTAPPQRAEAPKKVLELVRQLDALTQPGTTSP